ncbi:DUF2867 domain-containing protein [Catenulispora pinisilvae]|uniref:DUF2867 domain-containing protein n=1 Tax=Catenulispora pinisilvae TaxID=2705253 RepID=UPI0018914A5A|nr:DUF2867 domain-containing protein [Catenulispora pinisilvae]
MPDFRFTGDFDRPAGDERTAEQWARAVWEGASPPTRVFLRVGWRCLGLRVPLAPERVLGWTVAESDPERVVLAAPSRLLAARNIVHLDARGVHWTTEVEYRGALGRGLWTVAAPIHKALIPVLVRRAARAAGEARASEGGRAV